MGDSAIFQHADEELRAGGRSGHHIFMCCRRRLIGKRFLSCEEINSKIKIGSMYIQMKLLES